MAKRDKEKLIKIGQDLFSNQGYHNTGTEEILLKAEYPRSSFYYHFKSKEGFALKVLEDYGNNAEQNYRKFLSDEKLGSPLSRLKYFTHSMAEYFKKYKFKKECLIQKFSIECAAINEVLGESTKEQMNKVLNTLKDCIEQGQAENEIRNDIKAMRLAEYFQAQWYGSFTLSRVRKDVSLFEANMKMAFNYLEG